MTDTSAELSRLVADAKKFADEYGTLLQVLVLPLSAAIAGGVKIARDRQRNRPDLHLELVDVVRAGAEENVTFGLWVTNLGEQAATRTRYTWTPRSSLIMTPVPAGFLVTRGEPRRFEFTMDSDELIGHGMAAVVRSYYRMLGWLELTYYAGWGLTRTVGTAIVVGERPELPVQLAKVPRPPWTEYIIPLKKWQEKRVRDQDIENLDRGLQRAREYLAERDINVELLAPRNTLNRLFAELRNRGWQASYGPGGRGYEVYARKEWTATGSTIRLSATTLVDAATLVVANAVEDDEQNG